MTSHIEGQCACGAVRYDGTGSASVALCYCETCRRQSGGAGIAWGLVDKKRLKISGELVTWRSSDHAVRQHCSVCGSILFLREDGRDDVEYAAGSVLNQDDLKPGKAIYVHRRPGWSLS
ncbi:GFA family protein [Allosphingosinicella sp.]|uniref:GFA family protein n=1 Tax=Allosphingosinicella sp. TaxID=2823234 RepID=UPI0039C862F1